MQQVTGVQDEFVVSRGQTGERAQAPSPLQPDVCATSALVEQVVFEQVTSLRAIMFGLVDDLSSHNTGASLGATVALTHLQDIANKLGVVESLLSPQNALGQAVAA